MKNEICPMCGGEKIDSSTSFTVDYSAGIVVVRDVPAKICTNCGEEWISEEVSSKLEEIVTIAKKQKQEIFIAKYSSYSLVS